VDARVGDLVEPDPYFAVRRRDVDERFLRRLQRHQERFAQIAVEAFDFAFGLRPVRRCEPDRRAVVFGDVEQMRIEAVNPAALQDDRLGVVGEHLTGNAAEERRRTLQAAGKRLGALVVGELGVGVE